MRWNKLTVSALLMAEYEQECDPLGTRKTGMSSSGSESKCAAPHSPETSTRSTLVDNCRNDRVKFDLDHGHHRSYRIATMEDINRIDETGQPGSVKNTAEDPACWHLTETTEYALMRQRRELHRLDHMTYNIEPITL